MMLPSRSVAKLAATPGVGPLTQRFTLKPLPTGRSAGLAEKNRRQVTDARQRLTRSGYPELGQLQCESDDDTLILHGSVSSYYLKQLAQTLVRPVEGVTVIVNRLRVD